jgi:hypothetical protein
MRRLDINGDRKVIFSEFAESLTPFFEQRTIRSRVKTRHNYSQIHSNRSSHSQRYESPVKVSFNNGRDFSAEKI